MQSHYNRRILLSILLGAVMVALGRGMDSVLERTHEPHVTGFFLNALALLVVVAGAYSLTLGLAYVAKRKGYAAGWGLLPLAGLVLPALLLQLVSIFGASDLSPAHSLMARRVGMVLGSVGLVVLLVLPDATRRGAELEDVGAFGRRMRLSVMMFLQYAIWGAWAPVLWPYLTDNLGMTNPQAAVIFSLLPLANILAPFTGGQIADRLMPTQIFLGIVQSVGGIVLLFAAKAQGFGSTLILLAVFSVLYAPTLALTNSLAFRHLKSEKDFGAIRVGGTIGWIAAGWILSELRTRGVPAGLVDCLALAGLISVIMGFFAFTLPHTPPTKEKAADPLAFREAFVLLKNPNFFIFMAIAFVVTTELQFYYGPTGGFLQNALQIKFENIPKVMSVAQIAEILAMAVFLPLALKKWGVRKTLAIGVIAWPLRYIGFAWAPYGELGIAQKAVIASLTLHGIGYAFFFVASQVFVDMVAPKDIRASAQSLLSFFTLGIGTVLGTYFTGWIMNAFPTDTVVTNWTKVFLVPCVLTVVCALAFLILFKDPEKAEYSSTKKEAAPAEV